MTIGLMIGQDYLKERKQKYILEKLKLTTSQA
jgi:hypothetical protein